MFSYPFDSAEIIKKRRALKKSLLCDGSAHIKKNIAVLGGSTTDNIVDLLELFLLDYGIEPTFYKSEYAQYWQDAMFPSEELLNFGADIIFVHTSNRNITSYPTVSMKSEDVDSLLNSEFEHFSSMWDKLTETFRCPIIQNNFEMPFFRLLGNSDITNIGGRRNFIARLNMRFYEYAQTHANFYINDLEYMASLYGLEKWSDTKYWNMYKYAMCIDAMPAFAFNTAHIIKSVFGRNKKALALDLDNTLWGGVVGDDGVDGIAIGQEVPVGQVFSEFQTYLKSHLELGILLTVCSKNDYENAVAGLNHPDGILKPDDFTVIKANWENKDMNISHTASELNILPESIVFVDDNPTEREIVKAQLKSVEAPDIHEVEDYIRVLDRNAYFEVTTYSEDDAKRNEMYKLNAQRAQQQAQFADYGEFLRSLEMKAVIGDFEPIDLARITQLTNKSNQFNVTTRRYTPAEMEQTFQSGEYIRLCGRLTDKFGDNGIVSVVIGKKHEKSLHIELWLMSCRVLKRDMEFAMLDRLVEEAKNQGVREIFGYYYPTAKNKMVCDLFARFGFEKIADNDGNTVWKMTTGDYFPKNKYINCERNKNNG